MPTRAAARTAAPTALDVGRQILNRLPLPPGMKEGLNFAARELTDQENLSSAGGGIGGIGGAALGGLAVGGPVGAIGGGILGALAGGTLASKYGEGKETGPALQEGATEALFEGIGGPIGLAKTPVQKLGRYLGYSALDPSPAALAEFWSAVRPGERFYPEEASRLVKDVMFDMSTGAPGSLGYAQRLGIDLDQFRASKLAALMKSGNTTGIGMNEMLSGLAELRGKLNTPGGALDIPGALSQVDAVETLVRERPAGDWRPQTAGALPMPPTVLGVPGQSARAVTPTVTRARPVPGVPANPEMAGVPPALGGVLTPPQFSGEVPPLGPASRGTAGTFIQPPTYPTGGTFRAEVLTLPEADQLMQRIDDALLTAYGKSAPAAMAGIKVPDDPHVQALKNVRSKLKAFMEVRAAKGEVKGGDATVADLNKAMSQTIPFERMAAEATGRDRGGPGLRLAMGRNGPRLSLFEYLSRRTAGYAARPTMGTAKALPAIGKLTPSMLRLLQAGLTDDMERSGGTE